VLIRCPIDLTGLNCDFLLLPLVTELYQALLRLGEIVMLVSEVFLSEVVGQLPLVNVYLV